MLPFAWVFDGLVAAHELFLQKINCRYKRIIVEFGLPFNIMPYFKKFASFAI